MGSSRWGMLTVSFAIVRNRIGKSLAAFRLRRPRAVMFDVLIDQQLDSMEVR